MRRSVVILAAAWAWHSGQAADLSEGQSAAAKKIYISKCARCHKFYEPTEYNDQEWSMWMVKMRKKARLNARDYDLVLRFTEVMRSEAKGGAAGGKASEAGP
jgi:hypothetical protein